MPVSPQQKVILELSSCQQWPNCQVARTTEEFKSQKHISKVFGAGAVRWYASSIRFPYIFPMKSGELWNIMKLQIEFPNISQHFPTTWFHQGISICARPSMPSCCCPKSRALGGAERARRGMAGASRGSGAPCWATTIRSVGKSTNSALTNSEDFTRMRGLEEWS